MKYYYKHEETNENIFIPEHISNSVLKQYLDSKFIMVIALSSFIAGFLLGIIAYAL